VTMQSSTAPRIPHAYRIRVLEYLDDEVAEWFRPLSMTREADRTTSLSGPVRDQAELHGLLIKLRDLNLTLLSVTSE
jgi:hypothetical protein